MTSFAPASPLAALSAEEFRRTVLALKPRTAVFDCDGTLWAGDAGQGFLNWSLDAGMVSRDTADWILGRYSEYLHGDVSEATMCGEMTQIYNRLPEDELRAAASAFFDSKIAPGIFPEMKELASALAGSGTQLWAVSSTNAWVIEHAVTGFGVPPERVLAARVEIVNSHATERLVAVPTGESKATALRAAGLHQPDAVFGNSIHDGAMLAIAGKAFAVNPSAALEELARLEGWSVYLPAGALRR